MGREIVDSIDMIADMIVPLLQAASLVLLVAALFAFLGMVGLIVRDYKREE